MVDWQDRGGGGERFFFRLTVGLGIFLNIKLDTARDSKSVRPMVDLKFLLGDDTIIVSMCLRSHFLHLPPSCPSMITSRLQKYFRIYLIGIK